MTAVQVPWNDEYVRGLNEYQQAGWMHPYTCGNDSRHALLVATTDGWVCPDCDYTQTWAHDFTVGTRR